MITSDPTGLVEWRGFQSTVSVGFLEFNRFELESQCINGEKWIVEIIGGGLSLGLSAGPVSWKTQQISLGDVWDHLKADPKEVFGADYAGVDATFSIPGIAGYGIGATVVGMDAPHVGAQSAGHGGVSGFDIGIDLSFGKHRINKRKVRCDDCETPIGY